MGTDVSMLKQIEDNGGKYYVNGEEADALEILKAHGVNWIRLRIWNDPTDENGQPLGGGNNDLGTTVAIATRAKALGLKFLLDFHYSDWWADPGSQDMPRVKALFSDDSIRDVPVMWDTVPVNWLEEPGVYTLDGTVEGQELLAAASVTTGGEKNYLTNAGFESGGFGPWVVNGDVGAVDISNERQNLHEGKCAMHYWANDAFEFTVSQTVTGLENGTYFLSAWIQGGGGEDVLQLYANCGGETQTLDIATNGWLNWKTPTIENINVSDGTCTVGLKVVASSGQWAFFDESSLNFVE